MKVQLFITVTLVLFFSLTATSFAATYYVKEDGSDSANGLSDANAWKTIAKVNSFSFSTGDDVYFKCDDTWAGEWLNIDWNGTSGNNATIGAYYGSGTIGVSGNKPIFDGNNAGPGRTTGLIQATSQSYITITNIKLTNSTGFGVNIVTSSDFTVTAVDIDKTYNAAIRAYRSSDGTIEKCDITDAGRMWLYEDDGPAVIALTPATTGCTVSKNVLHGNLGEGIGFYKSSDNNTAEYNVIYGDARCAGYIDRSRNCIFRHNLAYNCDEGGFGLNDEDTPRTQNCEILYNLVANCGDKGIWLSSRHVNSVIRGHKIYNNTIVECEIGILSRDGPYNNCEIKNNIIWCETGACTLANFPSHGGEVDFDYNLWSSAPDPDVRGPHDPTYAVPQLTKTTGWRLVIGGELIGKDFALKNGSPAIDSATPLGAEFKDGLECDESIWPAQIVTMDQNNEGSGWEIGADIHAENPAPIDPPTDLKIVGGN